MSKSSRVAVRTNTTTSTTPKHQSSALVSLIGSIAGGIPASSRHPTSFQRSPQPKPRPKSARTRILKAAGKEVGTHEIGGDNRGAKVHQYQRASGLKGTGFPWCQAFVDWATKHAGVKLGFKGADVVSFKQWAQQHDRLTTHPRPGDAVLFDWDGGGPDHVGLVKNARGSGITTIEGNTSDPTGSRPEGVYQKHRDPNQIDSYVRLVR